MNEKALSLLGMARRAGRLSCGHDAAVEAIVKNRACLCAMSMLTRGQLKVNMEVLGSEAPMAALSKAIGTKAAVITVNDPGFAARLQTLLAQEPPTGKEEDYAESEI